LTFVKFTETVKGCLRSLFIHQPLTTEKHKFAAAYPAKAVYWLRSIPKPSASGTIIPNDKLRESGRKTERAAAMLPVAAKKQLTAPIAKQFQSSANDLFVSPSQQPGNKLEPTRDSGGSLRRGKANDQLMQAIANNQRVASVENELYAPSVSERRENRTISNSSSNSRASNFNVNFQIYGADDPETVAKVVEQKLRRFKAEIEADLEPEAVARRVAFAAERDSERT
jgi:hypothetical protein